MTVLLMEVWTRIKKPIRGFEGIQWEASTIF